MTSASERRLAAVNGVVSASKVAQGEEPGKRVTKSVDITREKLMCSICNSECVSRAGLKQHFVTCVERNGNPNGACWNDLCRHHMSDTERFAATNGIVIPSKLSAGQLPDQGLRYIEGQGQRFPCIICGRKFVYKCLVRKHFGPCVERNGNPTGARWFDALEGTSPGSYRSTQSSESQDIQSENSRPEDYEPDDVDNYVPGVDNFLFNSYNNPDSQLASVPPKGLGSFLPNTQQIEVDNYVPEVDNFLFNSFDNPDSQLTSVPSNGLRSFPPNPQQIETESANPPLNVSQQYDPYFTDLEPQPSLSPPNTSNPYDPHLETGLYTAQGLFSILEVWQDIICADGAVAEPIVLEDSHFQQLMKELVRRRLVGLDWKWIVNVENVDWAYIRADHQDLGT